MCRSCDLDLSAECHDGRGPMVVRKGMTGGEVRTTSSTGGEKGVKAERMDLIPPEALLGLSRIYGKGAEKYADHNYRKGYEWSKSLGALLRHVLSFQAGEDLDPETGEPHILHAAWHCFALYMFMQDHPQFDDRFSTRRAEFIPPAVDEVLTAYAKASGRQAA